MTQNEDMGLLILRLGLGLLFLLAGFGKLTGILGPGISGFAGMVCHAYHRASAHSVVPGERVHLHQFVLGESHTNEIGVRVNYFHGRTFCFYGGLVHGWMVLQT